MQILILSPAKAVGKLFAFCEYNPSGVHDVWGSYSSRTAFVWSLTIPVYRRVATLTASASTVIAYCNHTAFAVVCILDSVYGAGQWRCYSIGTCDLC